MTEYAETIQRIVDAMVLEAEAHWLVGAALQEIPDTRGAAKGVASDVGRSSSWVSEHRRTFAAFPEVEDRAADMPWGIHVMCARTDDPETWLGLAVAEQLSTRELRERMIHAGAIQSKGERSEPSPKEVERLTDHMVRMDDGDRWPRGIGRMAVDDWEALAVELLTAARTSS